MLVSFGHEAIRRETFVSEALTVLMLCAPNNRRRPFSNHTKLADLEYFRVLSVFSLKKRYKVRKAYRIWQVATMILINHNVGA